MKQSPIQERQPQYEQPPQLTGGAAAAMSHLFLTFSAEEAAAAKATDESPPLLASRQLRLSEALRLSDLSPTSGVTAVTTPAKEQLDDKEFLPSLQHLLSPDHMMQQPRQRVPKDGSLTNNGNQVIPSSFGSYLTTSMSAGEHSSPSPSQRLLPGIRSDISAAAAVLDSFVTNNSAASPPVMKDSDKITAMQSLEQQQSGKTAVAAAAAGMLSDCNVTLTPEQWQKALRNFIPSAVGSQVHGPVGANVFVFHIPNEWHGKDLALQFAQFGPILSARIATDKATGRRLGFGFVSYTNIADACEAVAKLNGHSVAGKRLKVTIKRGEQYILAKQASASLRGMTSFEPDESPTSTSNHNPSSYLGNDNNGTNGVPNNQHQLSRLSTLR